MTRVFNLSGAQDHSNLATNLVLKADENDFLLFPVGVNPERADTTHAGIVLHEVLLDNAGVIASAFATCVRKERQRKVCKNNPQIKKKTERNVVNCLVKC